MRASFASAASIACIFAASACSKPVECTAEVTEGAGTYRASVRTTEPEAKARRGALDSACEKLCRARVRDGEPDPNQSGCIGRCVVDVQAGKVGGRVRCER